MWLGLPQLGKDDPPHWHRAQRCLCLFLAVVFSGCEAKIAAVTAAKPASSKTNSPSESIGPGGATVHEAILDFAGIENATFASGKGSSDDPFLLTVAQSSDPVTISFVSKTNGRQLKCVGPHDFFTVFADQMSVQLATTESYFGKSVSLECGTDDFSQDNWVKIRILYSDTSPPDIAGREHLQSLSVTEDSIRILWKEALDKVTDRSRLLYDVYRTETPGSDLPTTLEEIKTGSILLAPPSPPYGTTFEYLVADLRPATRYQIAVGVSDSNGNSALYNFLTAYTAPRVPTIPLAQSYNKKIQLDWTAVPGVSHYAIYWSNAPGVAKSNNRVVVNSNQLLHSNLVNQTTYYYRLAAVADDSITESGLTEEVSATPVLPSPARVTAAPGNSKIILTWDSVTEAESYNVYWSTTDGVNSASTKIAGVTSPYTHTGLINGVAHWYRVTAVANGAESEMSVTVSNNATPNAWVAYPHNTPGFNDFPMDDVGRLIKVGDTMYLGTAVGLSISTDNGEHWVTRTTANGLPESSVKWLAVSGSAIFVATTKGLAISENGGVTFTSKTTADGLGSDFVNHVIVEGSLVFVATTGGLAVSTNGGLTFSNRTTAQGLGNNSVSYLYRNAGKLYAATSGGLSISNDDGSSFVNKTTANGLSYDNSKLVFADGQNVYVAPNLSNLGLSYSADGGETFVLRNAANNALPNNWIFSLLGHNGMLYVGTIAGLGVSADYGATFIKINADQGLIDQRVRYSTIDGDHFYASTTRGLCKSSISTFEFTCQQSAKGLKSGNQNWLHVEGQNIYMGSPFGVAVSDDGGRSFSNRSTADGLPGSVVRRIRSNPGKLFVSTGSGLGISIDGGKTFAGKTATDGLASNDVRGTWLDGSNLYVATTLGLSISGDHGATFVTNRTTADGLPGNFATDVWASGTNVIVGTLTGLGVSTDSGVSFVPRTTIDGLGANAVNAIFVDWPKIYVATDNGLSISTNGGVSFVNKTTTHGLGSLMTRSLVVQGSTITVGTDAGISISLDSGVSFTNYSTSSGLGGSSSHFVGVSDGPSYWASGLWGLAGPTP